MLAERPLDNNSVVLVEPRALLPQVRLTRPGAAAAALPRSRYDRGTAGEQLELQMIRRVRTPHMRGPSRKSKHAASQCGSVATLFPSFCEVLKENNLACGTEFSLESEHIRLASPSHCSLQCSLVYASTIESKLSLGFSRKHIY